MKENNSLLEGDIGSQLRRISIPLFWGLTAIMSLGVVDSFFVAKLGTDNLSALGFAMPVVMIFMSLFFGLNVGSTFVISTSYGKGDFNKLRNIATNNILFAVIFTVIASVIGYISIDKIFILMGATEDILPLIREYMQVWFFGMVFFSIIMIGNSTLRGMGDTKTPALLMISSALLNAAIDPFLIFGLGPFPKMGISGASMAIVITDIIISITLLYILIAKRKILAKPVFNKDLLKSWKEMLHVAIPSIFSSMFIHVSGAITVWIVADIGKEAVAALGVASRVQSLTIIIFFAIGGGLSIFTGQNFGVGNFKRIYTAGNIAAKYCIIWGIGSFIILSFFADNIAALFDSNKIVTEYTILYLHIVPISYAAVGLIFTSNSIFNAMRKPFHATAVILLRVFVLYIPLALIGKEYYGFAGILFARSFTNLFIGIFAHLWNKKTIK